MRILIIEDQLHMTSALPGVLRRFGYDVDHVTTGTEGLRMALTADFVLLDLDLPDLEGEEVCRRLRTVSRVPIMIVTARSGETDRVVLLQCGADDYLVKPFSTRELIARIESILRRTKGWGVENRGTDGVSTPTGPSRDVRDFGPLRVDLRVRTVRVACEDVTLTRREFDLLAALLDDPGAVRSREDLIDEVWDANWHGSTRTLDVHVGSLRSKLGHRDWVRSVRGVGFRVGVPDGVVAGI